MNEVTGQAQRAAGAQDECSYTTVYGGERWCDTHDSAYPCAGVHADPLPLVGRERFMIERLAKVLHSEARRHWDYGQLWEVARGNTFEVLMPDGRVAKVAVTLDRIIPEEQR